MRTQKALEKSFYNGTAVYIVSFALAIIVRLRYFLVTSPFVRQHDIYDNGHLDYIERVFTTMSLPETNLNELCQPPLHYYLTAIVMRIASAAGAEVTMESKWLQALPFFLSILILPVLYLVINEMSLPKEAKATAFMLAAFCPGLIYMSAQINNDQTMIFFGLLAILFTLRYSKKYDFADLMLSGVFIGLSMMSKFSGAVLSLFMAPLMLSVLAASYRGLKKKKPSRILAEWCAFLAVSGFLGLWYQVRQYIKFGQPLGYAVYPDPESLMYTGHTSRSTRFLGISVNELLHGYCDITNDRNVWTYMFKSSLFGEWSSWKVPEILKYLLLAAGITCAVCGIAGIFRLVVLDRKTSALTKAFVVLLSITQLAMFVYFNLNFPFTCSMDFRYVAFLAIPWAVALGSMKPYGLSRGLAYVYCAASMLFCMVAV